MAKPPPFEIKHLVVAEEHHQWRLDRFLAEQDFISSRSRASWLISNGLVTRSKAALKPSSKVFLGDKLEVQLPLTSSTQLEPFNFPLDILYEDDDCAVINKPAGLVVHPAAGHAQDTLVNALLHQVKNLSMGFHEQRPGIVHRLDKDTSGILVIAKNDLAHENLAKQFKEKSVHRVYWALVYGIPQPPAGICKTFLGRHPTQRKKFSSQSKGKWAVTHYSTIRSNKGISWLKCQLETGRTHQIRVHLSEKHHPILSDPIYGSDRFNKSLSLELRNLAQKLNRIGLHACELGFKHPTTNKEMRFSVDWPEDLKEVVQVLDFLPKNKPEGKIV